MYRTPSKFTCTVVLRPFDGHLHSFAQQVELVALGRGQRLQEVVGFAREVPHRLQGRSTAYAVLRLAVAVGQQHVDQLQEFVDPDDAIQIAANVAESTPLVTGVRSQRAGKQRHLALARSVVHPSLRRRFSMMLQYSWSLPSFLRRVQRRNMHATVRTRPAARNEQSLHHKRYRQRPPYASSICARKWAQFAGKQRRVEKLGLGWKEIDGWSEAGMPAWLFWQRRHRCQGGFGAIRSGAGPGSGLT